MIGIYYTAKPNYLTLKKCSSFKNQALSLFRTEMVTRIFVSFMLSWKNTVSSSMIFSNMIPKYANGSASPFKLVQMREEQAGGGREEEVESGWDIEEIADACRIKCLKFC